MIDRAISVMFFTLIITFISSDAWAQTPEFDQPSYVHEHYGKLTVEDNTELSDIVSVNITSSAGDVVVELNRIGQSNTFRSNFIQFSEINSNVHGQLPVVNVTDRGQVVASYQGETSTARIEDNNTSLTAGVDYSTNSSSFDLENYPDCSAFPPVGVDTDFDNDYICDIWERDRRVILNNLTTDYIIPCTSGEGYDIHPLGDWVCPEIGMKDIFVEIDYMEGHYPNVEALEKVVKAFLNAPEPIQLHLFIDEAIPHVNEIDFDSSATGGFYDIKAMKFGFGNLGNNEKNADGTWVNPNNKDAKAHVFYYYLWAHGQKFNLDSSGKSEHRGNDGAVTLGQFPGMVGTLDQQAGTFMHELGHNLWLNHGGGEDDVDNCKPNLLSVMSYSRQFSDLIERPLDYSRQPVGTMSNPNSMGWEHQLVDEDGISGHPNCPFVISAENTTLSHLDFVGINVCDSPARVSSDVTIRDDVTFFGNLTVDSGAVLTIESGGSLNFDNKNQKILVEHESGILIKPGGKIHGISPVTPEDFDENSPVVFGNIDGSVSIENSHQAFIALNPPPDNCPAIPNSDQEDGDGDGIGDVCDVDPDGPPDQDDDGVINGRDNCSAIPNDQEDEDGDGIGDVCDDNPNQNDIDNDTISNTDDNCPATPNLDQVDDDGDGIGNVCETIIDRDSDGDQIPDGNDNWKYIRHIQDSQTPPNWVCPMLDGEKWETLQPKELDVVDQWSSINLSRENGYWSDGRSGGEFEIKSNSLKKSTEIGKFSISINEQPSNQTISLTNSSVFSETGSGIPKMTNLPSLVQICHISQEITNGFQTIMVSDLFVESHLAHGDYLGECGNNSENFPILIKLGSGDSEKYDDNSVCNDCFSPSIAEIDVGTTVEWINLDGYAPHSVTSLNEEKEFDYTEGEIDNRFFVRGQKYSHTFDQEGVYQYGCIFHPWMKGIIYVGESNLEKFSITVTAKNGEQLSGIVTQTDFNFLDSSSGVITEGGKIDGEITDKKVTHTRDMVMKFVTDNKGTGQNSAAFKVERWCISLEEAQKQKNKYNYLDIDRAPLCNNPNSDESEHITIENVRAVRSVNVDNILVIINKLNNTDFNHTDSNDPKGNLTNQLEEIRNNLLADKMSEAFTGYMKFSETVNILVSSETEKQQILKVVDRNLVSVSNQVPEFETISILILAISIVTIIALSRKSSFTTINYKPV